MSEKARARELMDRCWCDWLGFEVPLADDEKLFGWVDSMEIVEAIIWLEDELGGDIPESDIEAIATYGDAIRYLEGRLGK